jgi:hypothetical protein
VYFLPDPPSEEELDAVKNLLATVNRQTIFAKRTPARVGEGDARQVILAAHLNRRGRSKPDFSRQKQTLPLTLICDCRALRCRA